MMKKRKSAEILKYALLLTSRWCHCPNLSLGQQAAPPCSGLKYLSITDVQKSGL